jgi:serine/threonine-protein kinase
MAGLDATFVRSTLAYGKPLNEAFGTADTLAPIKLTQELAPKSSPAATMRRSTVLPRETLVDSQRALVVPDRTRYEQTRVLGEGGMGLVFGAHDNDIDRPVAVKRLRPQTRDAESLARFAEEIRMVGQLEHPNIVPIHDVGLDENGDYYFVMKYVEGESLEAIIAKLAAGDREYHKRFPFERRVEIGVGILEALHYAHGRGILHRDIKPANVMVGPAGEVMVMDWGIACKRDGPEAKTNTLCGTPLYMSPEQAASKPVDERSDLYSFSVLLYELLGLTHYLAGKEQLDEVLAGVQKQDPASLAFMKGAGQTSVPFDLHWFVKKGLQKDPSQRYQSANEALERLRARAEGKIPIQCPVTFIKRMTNEWLLFIDRHPVLGITAASVGVLGTMTLGALVIAAYR